MKLRISDAARRELVQIISFIAKDKSSAAKKWRDTFYEKCETLKYSPEIGRKLEELRPGLRLFPFGNYIVLYRIEAKSIDIIHIARGSRDLESLLQE